MAELEPAKKSNSNVILLETQDRMSDSTDVPLAGPAMCSTLLNLAASSWGAADQMVRSVMRSALHQTTGHGQVIGS